jgi:hypothetical protein
MRAVTARAEIVVFVGFPLAKLIEITGPFSPAVDAEFFGISV